MIAQGLASVDTLSQAQGTAALPDKSDKTDQAAHQFEGLLMGLLFQSMRKTVEPSGLLGDTGESKSTFEYLMDQAVIEKAVTSGRGWGLAERLKASWAPPPTHKAGADAGSGMTVIKSDLSLEKSVREKDVPMG